VLVDGPAVLGWQRYRELDEIAMMIARAPDPAASVPAAESAVTEFLDRLLGA
jgi:hypothetical protein